MRTVFSIFCLVMLLGITVPAEAQLRQDVPQLDATTRLYDKGNFSLNKFFDPAHFKMSHSFDLSAGSFGGGTSSLAMYTNSLQWQFSSKLAARADIALAFSPLGNSNLNGFSRGNSGRVFLRNLEVAYRPSKNTELHLSIRQNPYGSYLNPYGYYNPYGYSSFNTGYYGGSNRLFWNDHLR